MNRAPRRRRHRLRRRGRHPRPDGEERHRRRPAAGGRPRRGGAGDRLAVGGPAAGEARRGLAHPVRRRGRPGRAPVADRRRGGGRARRAGRRRRGGVHRAARPLLGDLFGAATADEQSFLLRLLGGELRHGALEGVVLDAVAQAADAPAAVVRRPSSSPGSCRPWPSRPWRGERPRWSRCGWRSAGRCGRCSPRRRRTWPTHSATGTSWSSRRWTAPASRCTATARTSGVDPLAQGGHRPGARARRRRPRAGRRPAGPRRRDPGADRRRPPPGRSRRPPPASAPTPVSCCCSRSSSTACTSTAPTSSTSRCRCGRSTRPGGPAAPDARPRAPDPRAGRRVRGRRAGRRARRAWCQGAGQPVRGRTAGERLAQGQAGAHPRLVVIGAEWGYGRRTGSLSNIHLGARDPDGGPPVMVGKTFKGMTDELLAWQTATFPELVTATDGGGAGSGGRAEGTVRLRPELVVEIELDGVQRSPRYPGGVALRFARVLRYRPDKGPAEAGHDRRGPRAPAGKHPGPRPVAPGVSSPASSTDGTGPPPSGCWCWSPSWPSRRWRWPPRCPPRSPSSTAWPGTGGRSPPSWSPRSSAWSSAARSATAAAPGRAAVGRRGLRRRPAGLGPRRGHGAVRARPCGAGPGRRADLGVALRGRRRGLPPRDAAGTVRGAVGGLGGARLVGPLVAGVLTAAATWRLVFLGILPLVAAGLALVLPALRTLAVPSTTPGATGGRRWWAVLSGLGVGRCSTPASGWTCSPCRSPWPGRSRWWWACAGCCPAAPAGPPAGCRPWWPRAAAGRGVLRRRVADPALAHDAARLPGEPRPVCR